MCETVILSHPVQYLAIVPNWGFPFGLRFGSEWPRALSDETGLQIRGRCSWLLSMRNPLRYFHSSPEVIRLAVMMYVRYPLSIRQVEDLLLERGINISH